MRKNASNEQNVAHYYYNVILFINISAATLSLSFDKHFI